MHTPLRLSLLATAALLAACGGGNDSPPRGSIAAPTESTQSFTTTSFSAQVNASAATAPILQVAGAPTCGVDVQRIRYNTVGGTGEATTASAALMVPTGTAAACTGARPIVLYAHGTTADRNYNLASFAPTNAAYGEALLVAAMYAAQGFVVVAPNYAGYDSSALNYHPYLNANQQSSDMVDALAAARSVLATGRDNGKLFITGYSQGGYVAMATHRAMQARRPDGDRVGPAVGAVGHQPAGGLQLLRRAGAWRHGLHAAAQHQLAAAVWQRLQQHHRCVRGALRRHHREPAAEHAVHRRVGGAPTSCPATQALYFANAQRPLAVPALTPFGFYGPNNLIKSTFLASALADIAAPAAAPATRSRPRRARCPPPRRWPAPRPTASAAPPWPTTCAPGCRPGRC